MKHVVFNLRENTYVQGISISEVKDVDTHSLVVSNHEYKACVKEIRALDEELRDFFSQLSILKNEIEVRYERLHKEYLKKYTGR